MKVTDEEMEKAILFLAESDASYAAKKAFFHSLERQTKTIKAMAFTRAAESSAAAKEQHALISPPYRAHLEKIDNAELDYLTLHEQRNTAITMIEIWRSLNSARSKGAI